MTLPKRWRPTRPPSTGMGMGMGMVLALLVAGVLGLLAQTALAAPGELKFSLVDPPRIDLLCPGEARPIRLTLKNEGTFAWQDSDRVSYHWRDSEGNIVVKEGRRTPLPSEVKPGASISVDAVIKAPELPGTYVLQWRMVRQMVKWFPDNDIPRIRVEVAGTGPSLAWSIGSWQVEQVRARSESLVQLELRNEGCAPWNPALGDRISYRWLDAQGTQVAEGVRTTLRQVGPGESVVLEARLVGPPRPGPFTLHWEPVREHVQWFGDPVGPGHERKIDVGASPLTWSIAAGGTVPSVGADSTVLVPITLRNDGQEPWSRGAGDRLSYHWEHDGTPLANEGVRTGLPHAIAAGASIDLQAKLLAPAEPGDYTLRWELVREGVTWYGPPRLHPFGREPTTAVQVVEPALAWELVEIDTRVHAWAGEPTEMRVVLRNVGSTGWSSQLQDRLSYRMRDDEGRLLSSEGPRTELPHEVAPGETLEVMVRVMTPPRAGTYSLELRMVREHVGWFGQPRGEVARTVELSVWWRSPFWALAFLGVVVGLGVAGRRIKSQREPWHRTVDLVCWPVWTFVAIWGLNEGFAEFSLVRFWEGARWVTVSASAVFACGVALVPRRFQPWVALVVTAALTTLLVGDLAYVGFFGSLVPISAVRAIHHLSDARTAVFSLLRGEYTWMLLFPMCGGALLLRRAPAVPHPVRWRWALSLGLAVLGSFSLVKIGTATTSSLGVRVFSETHNAGRMGVVAAHLFQAARALRELGGRGELDPNQRSRVRDYLAANAARPRAPDYGVASGANLVVLQVEALQGWVIGAELDGQEITPFLNRATDDAVYFENVFDQTAQGRTSDAEFLVLSSGHALSAGALSFLRADNDFSTIAHVLKQGGYATLSTHPYQRGFWNRAVLHPSYGFDESMFARELGPGPVVGWGLADGPFLSRLGERIERMPQPFFAFAITLSLHHPYESFPDNFKSLDVGDLEGTSLGNYLHAMNYFDRSLEAFFGQLARSGLRSHTLVELYGDHVAGLEYTHELLTLAGLQTRDKAVSLWLKRVPAFIWRPDGARGAEAAVGGQIDLGTTAVHLLGHEVPPAAVGGVLVGEGPGFAALPDGSAVASDRMFVARGVGVPREGLCFGYPSRVPRPLGDCDSLRAQAREQVDVARTILDYNLHEDP